MLITTSCSDFLDTAPYDALSPATTWKTEADAEKFLVGCYDGWISSGNILYWDCASDFGYNNFSWEGWKAAGNGTMSSSMDGGVPNFYDFSKIRGCNDFLTNIANVPFENEAKKKDMIAQVKVIRALDYFEKNWNYGGVPIIESFESAEEAMVPRNTEAEVNEFIENELDEAIPMFLEDKAGTRGYIDRATALAVKMRHALYYEKYDRAKEAAKAIIDMGEYELEPDFLSVFNVNNKDSKEIIASAQHIETLHKNSLIAVMYNNGVGGWSSIVPTMNVVDNFEMDNGLTMEEAKETGYYDPIHPFAHRDPRMAMTVAYPGMDWENQDGSIEVFNTFDEKINGKKNPNYPLAADNASKTGLTWGKYLLPMSQYSDVWNTSSCTILFRYAEVLLSYAEAENEMNGPSADVYEKLNLVRNRAGMPDVNENKYNTKEKLRELIRRERGAELAGEGLRRADILRWKDADGKLMAERVMVDLVRWLGTVDYDVEEPTMRGRMTPHVYDEKGEEIKQPILIESRSFPASHRYLPFSLEALERNPKLEQNPGY